MKKILLFILAFMIFPWSASAEAKTESRPLTLMIYLCGSDLETQYKAASTDLAEITEACSGNKDITVLLMAGGSDVWNEGRFSNQETVVLEVGARGSRVVRSYPRMNMGDPETLSAFLQFACDYRPDSQYALVLWDHGAGPMEGVCFDQQEGMDSLSMAELNASLKSSPFAVEKHLSWIGFDACLMATLETALICSPYTDYMVASQETEPVAGWNYSFLRDYQRDEPPVETCRRILDAYTEGQDENSLLTLSLIDLRKIPGLARQTEGFFDSLNINKYNFSGFVQCRHNAHSFGKANTSSDYDLVDMGDLADQLAGITPEYSAELKRMLSDVVLQTAGNQEHASGLSLYSPADNKNAFNGRWLDTYTGFSLLPDYNRFLSRFGSIWNGTVMADWSGLTGSAGPLHGDGIQTLSLTLTDEQLTHLAFAAVHILEDNGSDTCWYDTFLMDRFILNGRTLLADYTYEALYAVDDNGSVLTTTIPFTVVGHNDYLIFAFLEKSTILMPKDHEQLPVGIHCRKKEGTDELEICTIFPVTSDPDEIILGRQSVDLDPEKWPLIRFWNYPINAETNPDGTYPPVNDWKKTDGDIIDLTGITRDGDRIPIDEYTKWPASEIKSTGLRQEFEVDNTRPWKLQFRRRKTSGRNLAAQFVVTDTQGNRYGSNLIPLQDPGVISSVSLNCEPREAEGCRIQPAELKLLQEEDGSSRLLLRIQIKNQTDQIMNLFLRNLSINGIVLPDSLFALSHGDRAILPGETAFSNIYLDESCFPFRDDPVVRSIRFYPYFYETGFNMDFDSDPFTLETEMDVSMTSCPERPAMTPIAFYSSDGVCFELMSIETNESGFISGLLHIRNDSDSPFWIDYLQVKGDDYFVLDINETFVRNCLDIDPYFRIWPGGEGFFPFIVQMDPDRNIPITGKVWDSDRPASEEHSFSALTEIGFVFYIEDRIMDPTGTRVYHCPFVLPEPLELPAECHLVFDPAKP